MRIVVVEDQLLFKEFLIGQLQDKLGHDIVGMAEDGESAIRIVMEQKPDLLILDILIPKLSGIHVAKTIKEKLPRVRILILSGQVTQTGPRSSLV